MYFYWVFSENCGQQKLWLKQVFFAFTAVYSCCFCHLYPSWKPLVASSLQKQDFFLFPNSWFRFSAFLTFQSAAVTRPYAAIIKPEERCGRLFWKFPLLPANCFFPQLGFDPTRFPPASLSERSGFLHF